MIKEKRKSMLGNKFAAKENPKSRAVNIRLTEDEFSYLVHKAEARDQTVTSLIRYLILRGYEN